MSLRTPLEAHITLVGALLRTGLIMPAATAAAAVLLLLLVMAALRTLGEVGNHWGWGWYCLLLDGSSRNSRRNHRRILVLVRCGVSDLAGVVVVCTMLLISDLLANPSFSFTLPQPQMPHPPPPLADEQQLKELR